MGCSFERNGHCCSPDAPWCAQLCSWDPDECPYGDPDTVTAGAPSVPSPPLRDQVPGPQREHWGLSDRFWSQRAATGGHGDDGSHVNGRLRVPCAARPADAEWLRVAADELGLVLKECPEPKAPTVVPCPMMGDGSGCALCPAQSRSVTAAEAMGLAAEQGHMMWEREPADAPLEVPQDRSWRPSGGLPVPQEGYVPLARREGHEERDRSWDGKDEHGPDGRVFGASSDYDDIPW